MCQIQNVSQIVVDAIKAEVDNLINERKMFTIWDAITCARKTTKAFLGQYKDLRSVVPELYNQGDMPGYGVADVSFSDRKGGMTRGRVFFPDDGSIDPLTYDPNAIHGDPAPSNGQSSPTPVVVSNITPADDEETEAELVGVVTKAYRLNVSPELLFKTGFMPGQQVYMTYHPDLSIGSEPESYVKIAEFAPGRILKVNKDYRLRITGKWLAELCLNPIDSSTKFKMMVVKDKAKNQKYIKIIVA